MPKQITVPIDQLRPNPWNSNHISPENEPKLAESLRQFGLFKPIVVRTKYDGATDTPYEILGGEQRWTVAKDVGLVEVPIFDLGEISDEVAKRITLADNARYGVDDTAELAALMEDIGNAEDIQSFLPYTDADVNAIFTSNIALDELDLPDGFDEPATKSQEDAPVERAPKTHTMMRFKVGIGDAEKITEKLAKIQKKQGFTASDELTNAGDALVHLLFGAGD